MSPTTTSPSKQRTYMKEPYLRAEHLLRDGRYRSVTVKVSDIVYNCTGKNFDGSNKKMLGLAFEGREKILGLNVTNENLMAWVAGDGDPAAWKGHEIQLVVRLIDNKKDRVKEPAIRIWPSKPHPNKRVRDEMGADVGEDWYREHRLDNLKPDKQDNKPDKGPDKPDTQKKSEVVYDRSKWIGMVRATIAAVEDEATLGVARQRFNALGNALKEHGEPLSDAERKELADLTAAAKKKLDAKLAEANTQK